MEQILGRILRLPYTRRNAQDILNISYVITSSNNFQSTLENVIAGLNNAGFSNKDYRLGTLHEIATTAPVPIPSETDADIVSSEQIDDDVSVDTEKIKAKLDESTADTVSSANIVANEMLNQALEQTKQYEEAVQASDNPNYTTAPPDVKQFMSTITLSAEFALEVSQLLLPQFFMPQNISWLPGDSKTLLTKEALTERFTLRGKDTDIDFSSIDAEIARIDIDENAENIPKAFRLEGIANQHFQEWFNSLTSETKRRQCEDAIVNRLNKINYLSHKELVNYVRRVIDMLSPEQLEDLQQSTHVYIAKIKKKINALVEAHSEKEFFLWVEQGKVSCESSYAFPGSISPLRHTSKFSSSLYTSEEAMNEWEEEVVWRLLGTGDIRWWHRNISRKGFNINGFINHYPDIIAMTKGGKILAIEPKGDYLDNDESRQKAKLGKVWQNEANKSGDKYRYYMVFQNKDLKIDGAVKFERLLEIVRGL